MKKRHLAAILLNGTCALSWAMPGPADAQATAAERQVNGRPAAAAREASVRFDIPAGPLKPALDRWAEQSGRQVLYIADEVAVGRTRGFKGVEVPGAVLLRLLLESGFTAREDASGAVAITRRERSADAVEATPDILVQGKKDWSLNLGIERTKNDSQPFIVLTAEDIKRSGAPDLETFLRNQLSVNNTAGTSSQAGLDTASNRVARGLSQVNLRGLGARETLILVDGRRQPGVNLGNGTFGQPQITGIPLASIERIEVLASSASSIYGSGASGGAINIVLKQAYSGGEITGTYADTGDLAAGNARIDISLAKTFEGGRTNVSFGGSWRKALPLKYGDRLWIRDENVAETIRLTGSNPLASNGFPPTAVTPNYQAPFGQVLQLKPQYGGTKFNTRIGTVPEGYRGLLVDGVAPLVANIGTFNLEAPEGVTDGGRDAPLIYGSEVFSGLLSVRRRMNDWMTLYARGQASLTKSRTYYARGVTLVSIDAKSPSNPFVSAITVNAGLPGEVVPLDNEYTSWNVLGGGIFKLPYGWQANIDISYARTRYALPDYPTSVSVATGTAMRNGTINLLRDLFIDPPPLTYASGYLFANDPQTSSTLTTSLRLAGPLPVTLPGGKVQLTVNAERSDNRLNAALSSASVFGQQYTLNYRPTGRYTLWSGYSEIAFPILSPSSHVPFVRMFDIRISARGERYTATGADATFQCYLGTTVPDQAIYDACPPPGYNSRVGSSTRSHIDPMVSFRWQPLEDLTFRASYGTGYLPPTLAQISKQTGKREVVLLDPQRNFEVVGTRQTNGAYVIDAAFGGNPDIKPEVARTFTAGLILTPRFAPHLRFSADWTQIRKRNNFFTPISFSAAARTYNGGPLAGTQLGEFVRFIEANPDRVVRGPATGGFAVGPITFIDFSLANYVGTRAEAVDFALDYWLDLAGGRLDVQGSATWNRKLEIETYPGQTTSYLGITDSGFAIGGTGNGALPWRGNASIRWSRNGLSVGVQSLVFDRYYLNTNRSVNAAQGSAYVPAQAYHNVLLSYAYDNGITLRAIINNVLDKTPPRDATISPLFYSRYGDPLGRNFQLSVTKAF